MPFFFLFPHFKPTSFVHGLAISLLRLGINFVLFALGCRVKSGIPVLDLFRGSTSFFDSLVLSSFFSRIFTNRNAEATRPLNNHKSFSAKVVSISQTAKCSQEAIVACFCNIYVSHLCFRQGCLSTGSWECPRPPRPLLKDRKRYVFDVISSADSHYFLELGQLYLSFY